MIRKGCCIVLAAAWLSLGVNWFVLDLLPGVAHDHQMQRQGMHELNLMGGEQPWRGDLGRKMGLLRWTAVAWS